MSPYAHFEQPRIEPGDRLRPHVVCRKQRRRAGDGPAMARSE
jgi:hypothetical protein